MKTIGVFSSRAEKYAKYRWNYATECINLIFEKTNISNMSIIADLGAGTGILTKEFAGKVNRIYAIEPDPGMRSILAKEVECFPSCQVIDACAEATTLSSCSIDLVTVAQAIHWFEPLKAKQEIYRILKPDGWLAICRNYETDTDLSRAVSEIYPIETDTERIMLGKNTSKEFYFDGNEFIKREFLFTNRNTWEGFLGALATASYAPVEGNVLYTEFEKRARQVFDRFNSNGIIEQKGITELYLGQIRNR